jgi:hypothetical protein
MHEGVEADFGQHHHLEFLNAFLFPLMHDECGFCAHVKYQPGQVPTHSRARASTLVRIRIFSPDVSTGTQQPFHLTLVSAGVRPRTDGCISLVLKVSEAGRTLVLVGDSNRN